MFEHFWARFMPGVNKPKSDTTLRIQAMRNLYLEEGRSHTDKPASAAVWLHVVGTLKRRLAQRKKQDRK